MIDSDDGTVSAAPAPITARHAINRSTEPENAAPIEPTAKTVRPTRKNRLRPSRSARLPPTSSKPCEDHRVGVDDPLQLARGRVQLPHKRGQRHIEDRVIDIDNQGRSTHHRQCRPAMSNCARRGTTAVLPTIEVMTPR